MDDPPPKQSFAPPSRPSLVLPTPPPPLMSAFVHMEKPSPPIWDVICLVACLEKHTKPGMENMRVICLSVPLVCVVTMTFLFVNWINIDIICTGHNADP